MIASAVDKMQKLGGGGVWWRLFSCHLLKGAELEISFEFCQIAGVVRISMKRNR